MNAIIDLFIIIISITLIWWLCYPTFRHSIDSICRFYHSSRIYFRLSDIQSNYFCIFIFGGAAGAPPPQRYVFISLYNKVCILSLSMYICICIYIYIYVSLSLCIYIYIYIYTCIHICIYVHIHTYLCINTYTYMYICVYISIFIY